MNLSLRVEKDTLVVTIYEYFDASAAHKFQKLLKRVKLPSYSHVMFDCTHVLGIDSSGLGMIFLVAHQLRKTKGHTCIINPRPQVRVLLEKADIPSLAPIFPSEREARKVA